MHTEPCSRKHAMELCYPRTAANSRGQCTIDRCGHSETARPHLKTAAWAVPHWLEGGVTCKWAPPKQQCYGSRRQVFSRQPHLLLGRHAVVAMLPSRPLRHRAHLQGRSRKPSLRPAALLLGLLRGFPWCNAGGITQISPAQPCAHRLVVEAPPGARLRVPHMRHCTTPPGSNTPAVSTCSCARPAPAPSAPQSLHPSLTVCASSHARMS